MRLGFITCHFPPDSVGGGQMQSMRLCEALCEKHEVTVFTRAYQSGLPRKEKTGSYVLQRRMVLDIPVLKSVVDLFTVLWQLKAHRKEIKTYFSFHIQLAALMVVLAKFFYGTKAIVSPRGAEDFDFKGYKKGFQKFIYTHADVILIQSEKIKGAFLANISRYLSGEKRIAFEQKIRIFPNGINVPCHFPQKLSERPNQIVFIGRLEAIKGLPTLVDAFRQCSQEIRLLIIGDGSQRSFLESYAKGLNVLFLGRCTEAEIIQHLKNAKALILPSLSENFPNVILEAFCAGVPVIASAVGAIPELIDDGRNGYLVPPSSADILAEKINAILLNNERLDDMGYNAYRQVAHYHWQHLIDQFDFIFCAN